MTIGTMNNHQGDSGDEVPPHVANFRWVMLVLDLLYPVLMAVQRHYNDNKYPSERFDDIRSIMLTHIFSGLAIISLGSLLQMQTAFMPIIEHSPPLFDMILYYIIGLSTIVHSATVMRVASRVMGERRLTLPLYILAGGLNLVNAIYLLVSPTLENAFLVWGSVNTFIFVRFNVILLTFAKVDWELSYTYSIISAAGITYPMTNQPYFIYYLGILMPLAYAPFHEKVSHFYGWDVEDTLGGNKPQEKNITPTTRTMRQQFNLSVRPTAETPITTSKTRSLYGSVLMDAKERRSPLYEEIIQEEDEA